jgi:ribosomal protein S18 acetylase RimI-like enzyme
MAQVLIREATSLDIPALLWHRRLMWWKVVGYGATRRDRTLPDGKGGNRIFLTSVAAGFLSWLSGSRCERERDRWWGIVISPWPGVLGQLHPKRAMILNLYVDRDHRRRGVARELMKTMIAWCRENEFSSVALHASDDGFRVCRWYLWGRRWCGDRDCGSH